MKKVLAILLSVALVFVMLMPASVVQAKKKIVENGWAGEHATCNISKDNTLIVKGKGSVKLKFKGDADNDTIKKVIVKGGITGIGERGLSRLEKAIEIQLPQSLTSLEHGAFSSIYLLKGIRLPEGIRKLPDCAFNNCYKLKSIYLPKNLRVIGESAFEDCKSLKTLKIPNKVTSIGKDAFKNCNSLETLVLPKNLRSFKADFTKTPMLHKVVNRSGRYIPLDSAGGRRVWKVNGKKVTRLAPGKTATTKGVRHKITYDLSGGKPEGKLPKYYYYGKAPKLPEVKKKGYEFLGWRWLGRYENIPVEFPAACGSDVKMTAMLARVKAERLADRAVRFTVEDNVKWVGGTLWKNRNPKKVYERYPEYVIRIFTKQPEWEDTEDIPEPDFFDDTAVEDDSYDYYWVEPGCSYTFRTLKPGGKYYYEISFRWAFDAEDDPGDCSGWYLHKEVPEWTGPPGTQVPEDVEDKKDDDDDDEYELYPPEPL